MWRTLHASRLADGQLSRIVRMNAGAVRSAVGVDSGAERGEDVVPLETLKPHVIALVVEVTEKSVADESSGGGRRGLTSSRRAGGKPGRRGIWVSDVCQMFSMAFPRQVYETGKAHRGRPGHQ